MQRGLLDQQRRARARLAASRLSGCPRSAGCDAAARPTRRRRRAPRPSAGRRGASGTPHGRAHRRRPRGEQSPVSDRRRHGRPRARATSPPTTPCSSIGTAPPATIVDRNERCSTGASLGLRQRFGDRGDQRAPLDVGHLDRQGEPGGTPGERPGAALGQHVQSRPRRGARPTRVRRRGRVGRIARRGAPTLRHRPSCRHRRRTTSCREARCRRARAASATSFMPTSAARRSEGSVSDAIGRQATHPPFVAHPTDRAWAGVTC